MAVGMNRVAEQPRKLMRSTKRTVSEHAVPSAAVCLGIGFGVGFVLALSLPAMRREPDYGTLERYGRSLVDSIQRATPHWMGGK